MKPFHANRDILLDALAFAFGIVLLELTVLLVWVFGR